MQHNLRLGYAGSPIGNACVHVFMCGVTFSVLFFSFLGYVGIINRFVGIGPMDDMVENNHRAAGKLNC